MNQITAKIRGYIYLINVQKIMSSYSAIKIALIPIKIL